MYNPLTLVELIARIAGYALTVFCYPDALLNMAAQRLPQVPIVAVAVDKLQPSGAHMVGAPPSDNVYLRCAPKITLALDRLPRGITSSCMDRIIITSDLRGVYNEGRLAGQEFRSGGTYFDKAIVVNATSLTASDFDTHITSKIVYHEWSSLVLKKYYDRFDHESWNRCLPVGFHYDVDRFEPNDDDQARPTMALLRDGFIMPYAQTAMENDFNLISEWLFSAEPALWKWYSASRPFRMKVNATIEFYRRIDDTLTFEYFLDLPSYAPAAR